MTSKFIAAPPSRSIPPPDPPPQKLPLLGSLSPLEPLEPPGPSDPPDTSLVYSSLVHLYLASPLLRLFHLAVLLSLSCIWFVHESLMLLGFLTSFTVASCERWCRCSLLILWLLCSPCPSLMTSLVPDLFSTAWSSSRGDGSCQTSDLKTLRRALPFSCPRMMTILPSGKIYSTCFDSRKSLWVHHGNAGVYKFCWELRYVPSDIGVKPILLFTGVEESSSLMSNSFQEISHFTPLAITIHAHQMEIPSSEAYVSGIVGLSYIV
ncbi:hypothetical protein F2Q70_00041412 [Brassica cretica]|uniref:Uncharacterized protein n=1 Tax=Brassica cretica TaxID=69181 RepID=A0A8S9K3L7_BRACR|nr:hypothetical protein F2Q70_00041412 [Brassica cretica]KAF2617325.1 hypothetical protein F2Q68_00042065 [Brassica cretica]